MDKFLWKKISPVPSDSAEWARPKSRRKRSVSGVVLIGTPYNEPVNRPHMGNLPGGKPTRKALFAKPKSVAWKK
jgi:hypothetical protein